MGVSVGRQATRRARPGQLALWLAVACAPTAPVPPALEPPAPVARPVAPAPGPCLQVARIEVSKGERRLRAHCEGGAVVEMTVALGREPEGPKRDSGDWRTPEGTYRISEPPRPSPRFHLFIAIDYPSVADAELALAQARISRADYEIIVAAHDQGTPPPGDTALGGGLGFHGEGERWRGDSVDLDWTYGCVALTDAEIDFLAERVEVGTPVVILP